MSITIIAHDWKHRVTKTGVLQSCPVEKENAWWYRPQEEMNLTGGDIDLIKNTIVRLAECIPQNYELPHAEKVEEKKPVYVDEIFI
ncbi:MAG: hypothetical protein IMZ53_14625 [Thermoplasmata archaeon]|nr:hypothetical protein [Thermoplasmata archaeon]